MNNKKEELISEFENRFKEELTPEEQFEWAFRHMSKMCKENGWGDPLSYARGKEILAAIALGHKVSKTLSGADAYNQLGQPVEYKSTTGKTICAAYTGISVKDTWAEQERYLKKEKIQAYPEHYANRFDDEGNLVESWKLMGKDVYEILLPKLRKKWNKLNKAKTLADPRLSANLSMTEIKTYGTRVI